MVRRAFFAGTLLLVLSTSSVLAATSIVKIKGTGYVPLSTTVAMGGSVQWKNRTGKSRTVAADTSYVTSWFLPNTTVAPYSLSVVRTFPEAGSFGFHDTTKATLRGTIVVPMTASVTVLSVNESVTLTLGTAPTNSTGLPVAHYVQASKDGGAWTLIAQTNANTFGWKVTSAGTYQVRTYLHHLLSGANTGVSPTVTITAF